MANLLALHSVGDSLVNYLQRAYPADLQTQYPCQFSLVSSGELASETELDDAVTLYLYRVSANGHLRNAGGASAFAPVPPPLALDLHYLLTVWTKKAGSEHFLLAWAMHQLHTHPLLDGSLLSPDAGWAGDEWVQLVPAELSHEELFRIWDKLHPSYRLSVGYIARIVRIEPEPARDARPVVARRLAFGSREDEE